MAGRGEVGVEWMTPGVEMRQVWMDIEMSQATRNVVCAVAKQPGNKWRVSRLCQGRQKCAQLKRTLERKASDLVGKSQPETNLACMRTQQEVPKVTGRLDRHHRMVGRYVSVLCTMRTCHVHLAPGGAVPAAAPAPAAAAVARGPAEFGRHRGRRTGMCSAGSCATEMVDPKLSAGEPASSAQLAIQATLEAIAEFQGLGRQHLW